MEEDIVGSIDAMEIDFLGGENVHESIPIFFTTNIHIMYGFPFFSGCHHYHVYRMSFCIHLRTALIFSGLPLSNNVQVSNITSTGITLSKVMSWW